MAAQARVRSARRRDGEAFLALAPRVPVRTEVQAFSLERANDARSSRFNSV